MNKIIPIKGNPKHHIEIDIHPKRAFGELRYLLEDNIEAGHIHFNLLPKVYANGVHTYIHPSYQGQGIARQMAMALFDYCNNEKLIIRADCSYLNNLINKPDFPYPNLLEQADHSTEIIAQLETMEPKGNDRQSSYFFKTNRGDYAEHDRFLGISVPTLRKLSQKYQPCTKSTIQGLCRSEYHEVRWLGFYFLSQRMKHCYYQEDREITYQMFNELRAYCNNWDLVDNFASIILGLYWGGKSPKLRQQALSQMAQSGDLWAERMSILATLPLIRKGNHEDTLHIARLLLSHKHDLIHKSTGWMLREVGKHIDTVILTDFLDQYAPLMPRTTLRYAIEHLSTEQRKRYLSLKR